MLIPFDNTYARLPAAFFAATDPTPVASPGLIRVNHKFAEELGIDADRLDSPEGLAILSGNVRAGGSEPLAMAYSGHQFGGFSPQLGDGRAILLGEVVDSSGTRRDIQLKGSGPTPFSRRGDGRSALGPVLREYLVSEAMSALGVPTTRALAAVTTGERVFREETVPGGVFTRVARSHIRVGTFQWFAARQDLPNLRLLADYVINRHYPDARDNEHPYHALLAGVISRQAELIAHWMQLGFIHGVMNTDNMTVSGETIDFGPCAFLDDYDSTKRFSSIDHQGRYAFGNQGPIAHWNLTRLAETLLPLLDDDDDQAVSVAQAALDKFAGIYQRALQKRLTAKIGLGGGNEDDWRLVNELLAVMAADRADFTLTFRHLPAALSPKSEADLVRHFTRPDAVKAWLIKWRSRMAGVDPATATDLMRRSNPIFIPRNHRIEAAIQAGNRGDFAPFHQLNEVLQKPFAEQPEFGEYELAPKTDEIVHATFCGT